eukprot:6486078-Amphidinium_carterae.1
MAQEPEAEPRTHQPLPSSSLASGAIAAGGIRPVLWALDIPLRLYDASLRAYVVWESGTHPGGRHCWAGIHVGPNPWPHLLQAGVFVDNHYQTGRDHCRRVVRASATSELVEAAVNLYQSEAAKHNAPTAPRASLKRQCYVALTFQVNRPITITMTEMQSTIPGSAFLGRGRTQQAEGTAVAVQAATLLLTRPWLASLPLIDEGAATSLQEGMFTEVAILAVRWPGPAQGPIANCIIAVPATAVEGLAESFEILSVELYDPGSTTVSEERCE